MVYPFVKEHFQLFSISLLFIKLLSQHPLHHQQTDVCWYLLRWGWWKLIWYLVTKSDVLDSKRPKGSINFHLFQLLYYFAVSEHLRLQPREMYKLCLENKWVIFINSLVPDLFLETLDSTLKPCQKSQGHKQTSGASLAFFNNQK